MSLQERLIRLEADQTKNATARVIPSPSVVAEELCRFEPKTGTVFDATNLRTEWAKACTAVKLGKMEEQESAEGNKWQRYTGLIVHDLRRSAIRNMVEAVTLKSSSKKTGIKSVNILPTAMRGRV